MLIVALGVYAQSEWEYHIGLGGELKNGNVNTVTIRNNAEVERDDSLLAFDAGYGIVYGKMEKEVYDKSFSAQVKVDIWQYDRWSPFMSLNYLNNKFKGFEYRISGLIGLKYRILMDDNYDYSISAAYVQDYTDYGEYSSTLEKKSTDSRCVLRCIIE